jgi:hypothetical protein
VEKAKAVVVLCAAAGLQYYLVNLPVGDIEKTGRFSPAKVKAADEVVSFRNPETGPGRFSFSYEQAAESKKQSTLVDAYFDNAVLSQETLRKLAVLGITPPSGPAAISYLTSSERGAACSTVVQVDALPEESSARAVQFSQKEPAPSDRYRSVDIAMSGLDAVVTLKSQGPFTADASSPCQVKLLIGNWELLTQGFVGVQVQAAAGSGFRFRWEAADVQSSGWSSSGGPLLRFEGQLRQSFSAAAVAITPSAPDATRSGHTGLVADGERKEVLLKIHSLMIGTDRLQFEAIGRGRVVENGKVISRTNLVEAINRYPIISAMFAAGNLALLGWAKRKLLARPAAPGSEPLDSPSANRPAA